MSRVISAQAWSAFVAACDKVADSAAAAVEATILEWCAANPAATTAEARAAAIDIMARIVPNSDQAAAALSAAWYDALAQTAGVELPQAVTNAVYVAKDADEVARYQARQYEKSPAAFARACGEYARNDANRSVNQTIMANVKRDGGKGVRFARVCAGGDTCTFCMMLAGRGAVYHSRKTAGEFSHFHRNCRCKVVPGFEGGASAVLVEGRDPADMMDMWEAFKAIDDDKGLTPAERSAKKAALWESGGTD